MYDVVIIGGSYAGLSAALQLGRARRQVLILDAGQRRNRFASHAHGFLGHDGEPPDSIAAKGRAQVLAYPTVSLEKLTATEVSAVPGGFSVRAGDREFRSRKLILATGVVDELPAIEGIGERWGSSVFHCPYCHGYELNLGRLGVLATSPHSAMHALLVSEWGGAGQTTLYLNGASEPDAQQQALLAARNIRIERTPLIAAEGSAPSIDLRLRDGRVERLDGLFLGPRTRLPGPFAEQLGCELEQGPTGSYIKTDFMKQTSVPGVLACGDIANPMTTVSSAVGDGAMAGASVHRSLVFEQ
ncbi:MAG TPA: NAD(P)/FAD-dependent oxidoreductase [Polyangiales bacterium]|nr:NAD(P)/FAD-dependent oxidoreductase [Polyangiales bacterium]